ncbi:SHOCT domain-containing protein [Streptomyces pinistramenti]|uniref:SHOCT domain-containing protein n=1 Tax=Streptomyces pinistramenti TaxID=2884812 RepID=UPI001D06153E|nr:SHOCT domain-containing protein [Streptomyces pinistramenti]MCB5909463.1 SHOCT domain-containing protein [Streptomyces pinistramenti]
MSWVLIILGVVAVLRRTVRRHRGPGRACQGRPPAARTEAPAPIAVLGGRFAAGEIDEDEYRRRTAVLEEHVGPGPKGSVG